LLSRCSTTWATPSFLCWVCLFVAILGLELRAYTLSHSTSPFFCYGFFWDRVFRTICLGWLWTVILLISASWAVRITSVNHWSPVLILFYNCMVLCRVDGQT
jgi:hypothetical protein